MATLPPKPTSNQQYILRLAARANLQLRATRTARGGVDYRLVQPTPTPFEPARIAQVIHPHIVESLLTHGWIESAGSNAQEWWYRVTAVGIAAANGPARGA